GVARPLTPNCGWRRCPQGVPKPSSTPCWGRTPACCRSSGGSLRARRAIPSSWRRACAPYERLGYWWVSVAPIVWGRPCQQFRSPATVQAVLAALIDRLPSEEKRLLQTAAVLGTEVPLPLLQAIAELPEEGLQHGLAHLQAAEFLYEARLFPERE